MNYWKIDKEDVCNGQGLRVVLWLSGCSHKCIGCQNSQTWDADSGVPFDESVKEELFRELDKDYISGLTLTGGDPLFKENLYGVLDLISEIDKRYNKPQYIGADEIDFSSTHKSIWLYTGYKWEDLMKYKYGTDYINNVNVDGLRQAIVSKCDVLVDGLYIDNQRDITLPWRGSSNQRVINVKESLQKGEVVLWQT